MDGPFNALPGRLLDPASNDGARGMIVTPRRAQAGRGGQDSAYGALRRFSPTGGFEFPIPEPKEGTNHPEGPSNGYVGYQHSPCLIRP